MTILRTEKPGHPGRRLVDVERADAFLYATFLETIGQALDRLHPAAASAGSSESDPAELLPGTRLHRRWSSRNTADRRGTPWRIPAALGAQTERGRVQCSSERLLDVLIKKPMMFRPTPHRRAGSRSRVPSDYLYAVEPMHVGAQEQLQARRKTRRNYHSMGSGSDTNMARSSALTVHGNWMRSPSESRASSRKHIAIKKHFSPEVDHLDEVMCRHKHCSGDDLCSHSTNDATIQSKGMYADPLPPRALRSTTPATAA